MRVLSYSVVLGAALCASHAFGETTVKKVTMGNSFRCALLTDNRVKCWGANEWGQLGLGDTNQRGASSTQMGDNLPAINFGNNLYAVDIASGLQHSCAVLNTGVVKCWGYNAVGQLGLVDTNNRGTAANQMGDNLPAVNLGTGRTATAVAVGYYHSCALLDNKTVKCWGYNYYGQLGIGKTNSRWGSTAAEMGDGLPAINFGTNKVPNAITAFGYTTCAQFEDGTAKCIGYNGSGMLGLGENSTSRGTTAASLGDGLPVVQVGNRSVKKIQIGSNFECAGLSDGTIRCWGDNSSGQLCTGSATGRGTLPEEMGDALTTVQITNALAVKSFTCGSAHCCALLSNNGVKCWGAGNVGRLGSSSPVNQCDDSSRVGDEIPYVDLGYLQKPVELFGGGASTCARFDNGRIKCWGYNANGQLGIGTTDISAPSPSQGMGDRLPFINL